MLTVYFTVYLANAMSCVFGEFKEKTKLKA